jgi:hypothetical protein
MNTPRTKLAPPAQAPSFEQKIRLRPTGKAVTPPKPKSRDNVFSKSRDTREDRGSRQMKTSHNPQTFSHR